MLEKKSTVKKLPTCTMYMSGTTYSLTLTFSDSKQFWNEKCDRAYRFVKWVVPHLHKLDSYCKYLLYLEVSKGGRLHFHGTITPTDTLDFQLYAVKILESFGKYEIDTIADMAYWLSYCKKDSTIWQPRVDKWKLTKYPISQKTQFQSDKKDRTIFDSFGGT